MENKEFRFSIEVYGDHALIKGWLTTRVLKMVTKLCREEGFTHMTMEEGGFKLVRRLNRLWTDGEVQDEPG